MAICGYTQVHYALISTLVLVQLFSQPIHSLSIHFNRKENMGEPRILWNAVGDFIQSSQYFPITINIPDIFTGIGGMFTGVYEYFFPSPTQGEEDYDYGDNQVSDDQVPTSRVRYGYFLDDLYY